VTITGVDLPGSEQLMTFTRTETGEVLSSEIVPDDTALFVIDGPEGGDTVIGVTKPAGEGAEQPCDH
jgi:hypothetical protein